MFPSYILITPARNEEVHIEKTIRAVLSQSALPKKWLIISDGSTDRTEEIVMRYTRVHDFIELVRIKSGEGRDFGSKVHAFYFGYEKIKNEEYDFLGILDADVSFDRYYYENILTKFEEDVDLGIAGGQKYDRTNGHYQKITCSMNSVAGPFQLFRRQCFEDTGGFTPIPEGGEDAVIEAKARMHGWMVRTFPQYRVYHHRRTGTASFSLLQGRFQQGVQDYLIGYDPLFEFLRCTYRISQTPYILGAIATLSGYTWTAMQKRERPVTREFVKHFQSEQQGRIRRISRKSKISGPRR